MKNLNIILLFVLPLFILTPVGLEAQQIDSLINEAIEKNPQLQSLRANVHSAEYKAESVGYLPPPEIGIEFNQVPFDEYDVWNKALSQTISVSQMFPLGGKLTAMEEAERKGVDAASAALYEYRLKLIEQVKSQYYKLQFINSNIGIYNDLIDLLNMVYNSSEQMYTVNRTGYSNLMLIKAEIASQKTKQIVLKNRFRSEVYKLNALLGRDIADTSLVLTDSLQITLLPLNKEELYSRLMSLNPALDRMESMIEMNRLMVEANRKELIPDLMVGGMVMRMPQGMLLTSKNQPQMNMGTGETEYMYGLMASITLPFMPWSKGRITGKEEELLASIEGLSYEKENMRRMLISELNAALENLASAKEQVMLYENEIIPLYKKTIEVQLTEFQSGKTTINNLIETMRMLLMKKEEFAEAVMEHNMITAEILSITASE